MAPNATSWAKTEGPVKENPLPAHFQQPPRNPPISQAQLRYPHFPWRWKHRYLREKADWAIIIQEDRGRLNIKGEARRPCWVAVMWPGRKQASDAQTEVCVSQYCCVCCTKNSSRHLLKCTRINNRWHTCINPEGAGGEQGGSKEQTDSMKGSGR